MINNVSIIQGKDNLFVAMPSYKTKEVDDNNKSIYRDICYPITKEFREKLYENILEIHHKEREKLMQVGEQAIRPNDKVQKKVEDILRK